MRYENAVIKKISDIYDELKKEREESAEKRKDEVYSKYPRVKEIDDEIALTAIRVASKIAEGKNTVEELSKELMDTLKKLKTEKAEIPQRRLFLKKSLRILPLLKKKKRQKEFTTNNFSKFVDISIYRVYRE